MHMLLVIAFLEKVNYGGNFSSKVSYKIISKNLKISEFFMKRDWKKYNKQLVKRKEIIINEEYL